ncbi:MAG: hypothetical protein LBG06_01925 [Deltaproteobacteria bacterium]|nr:hypothetical protein [Deltaproteobacteria bacterium]
MDVPSGRVARRAILMSIPIIGSDGCAGSSGISRSVWIAMKIPEPVTSAVTFPWLP